MATYKIRGASHNVVYPYKTESGKYKQQWESYTSELEAITRQAYISCLQKEKKTIELQKAVNEYKQKKQIAKLARESIDDDNSLEPIEQSSDNLHRTYREFALKWLPFHARKNRLSPTTYDSYVECLEIHLFPYFGDRIMSSITSTDIDKLINHLSKKPCKGPKAYNKNPKDIPTLSSSSVKRHYNVFNSGLETAKRWGYISEIPSSTAPAEKTKKRKAWDFQRVSEVLAEIDDKILHLAVHLAFVCSLRAGETSGIEVKSIDFRDRSFWITQEVQRVSDKSLSDLPQNEIVRIFPKEVSTSKSHLILKAPKTDGSYRKQYLTTPLLQEISERLRDIAEYKELYGSEYKDYGLLLCKPDGRPCDPHAFSKVFKRYQAKLGISEDEQIEFQGLRKSGQMHKVRLSQNNYQLVAESSGQSPEVLMSNYNEALETEKRTLSLLVETSFYQTGNNSTITNSDTKSNIVTLPKADDKEKILDALQNDPIMAQQILQQILSSAVAV